MRLLSPKFICSCLLLVNAAPVSAADAPAPAAQAPKTDTDLPQTPETNAVAATVNGEIVTILQLHKQILPAVPEIFARVDAQYGDKPDLARKVYGDQLDALGKELLHSMVDRKLVIQEFDSPSDPKKAMKIPTAYIDQQFDDRMTTQFGGDRVKFLNYLAANGQSESEFRQDIEDDIKLGFMRGQIHNSASGISPVQIKEYYDSNKEKFLVKDTVTVRQITLTSVADFPLAEQAAKIVQEARLPGANFVALVRKYSTDLLSKQGDVPPQVFEKGRQQPVVEDAVFKLEPGEVSDPVVIKDAKTGATTLFIFKCEDKTVAGYLPLEKVHGQIEVELTQQEDNKAWEKWLQKLRDKAYIVYML